MYVCMYVSDARIKRVGVVGLGRHRFLIAGGLYSVTTLRENDQERVTVYTKHQLTRLQRAPRSRFRPTPLRPRSCVFPSAATGRASATSCVSRAAARAPPAASSTRRNDAVPRQHIARRIRARAPARGVAPRGRLRMPGKRVRGKRPRSGT